MKIKQLKEIFILGNRFKITWDKNIYGGSFDSATETIIIGCKCIETNPQHVFMILMHEVSEFIHTALKVRYGDPSVEGNYKFFLDHKEFENHNSILSEIILKFIQ